MNPNSRPPAAPAPASAPYYPLQWLVSQPTAAAGVRPGQTPPTAQPVYPSTRAAPRAAGPSSSTHPAAPAAPSSKPGSSGPGVGPVRTKHNDIKQAAARAVPADPRKPGYVNVRHYPPDRHFPKPPLPNYGDRWSLFTEYQRTHPAVSSNSGHPNRPPAPGPARPKQYNPYQSAATTAPTKAPAPAPASQPPTAERARTPNPSDLFPLAPRR